MSFINPCFFCSKVKQNSDFMLCNNCIYSFADYKFYCCPRCSQFNCSGCENLSEFQSIFAVYSYNSIISKIIAGAKDKFNMHFQKIFEEIFFENTKKELENILSHKNYSIIILSPYRKSRIFHGYWHPNLFFEKIFQEIKLKKNFEFKIITPHYTTKKSTCVHINNMNISITPNDKILLCDDVLTTGSSALKSFHAINKYFENLNPTHKQNNNFDLFTIFRTPQK